MEWGQVGASGVSTGHRSHGGVQRKGRPFQRLWGRMGLMLQPTPLAHAPSQWAQNCCLSLLWL